MEKQQSVAYAVIVQGLNILAETTSEVKLAKVIVDIRKEVRLIEDQADVSEYLTQKKENLEEILKLCVRQFIKIAK